MASYPPRVSSSAWPPKKFLILLWNPPGGARVYGEVARDAPTGKRNGNHMADHSPGITTLAALSIRGLGGVSVKERNLALFLRNITVQGRHRVAARRQFIGQFRN